MNEFLNAHTVWAILSNSLEAELLIRVGDNGLYRVAGAEVSGSRVVLQVSAVPVSKTTYHTADEGDGLTFEEDGLTHEGIWREG